MTWLALYRPPEDRWHSECDHGNFVLALQSGNIQHEKKPLVLLNILVVKDLYESFTYSLAIERTRNSITARGHNLHSYTVILWLIKEKVNFFCAFVFTHLKTLKGLNGLGKYEQLIHVCKTSLTWKRICFYFLNYFLLRSRWLTLKLWACTFMSADPLYKILFTTWNEIQRRVKVRSSTIGIT